VFFPGRVVYTQRCTGCAWTILPSLRSEQKKVGGGHDLESFSKKARRSGARIKRFRVDDQSSPIKGRTRAAVELGKGWRSLSGTRELWLLIVGYLVGFSWSSYNGLIITLEAGIKRTTMFRFGQDDYWGGVDSSIARDAKKKVCGVSTLEK